MKTVGLIGLGALGIMFGWELQQKLGDDFCVIIDKERLERYRREGIFSNKEECKFRYVTPEEATTPLDLVLFSTKIGGLRAAIETAAPFIGPNTAILSILNGVSSEEILSEAFGSEKVLYAVAQEMDAVREGNGVVFKNMGCILYGEPDGQLSRRATDIEALLKKGGVNGRLSCEARRILWNKLMINVGVNQVCASYNATYGQIINDPKLRELFVGAMREAKEVANKEGVDLTEEDVNTWLRLVEKLDVHSFPSMLQDIKAKRPTEIEIFGKTIVRLGKKHSVPTPINASLVEAIEKLESEF